MLDYAVTANHIHLLACDHERDEISASMQLIAGRTVGRKEFVEAVGKELGVRARYRQADKSGDLRVLREAGARYAASLSRVEWAV